MPIRFRFIHDKDVSLPHCWVRHLVTEGEAIEAWYKGKMNETVSQEVYCRKATLKNGKEVQVVWKWLSMEKLVLIITAYEPGKEAYYEGQ